MIELKPEERKILYAIGRTNEGRNFAVILDRLKDQATRTTAIDPTRDAAAQVEGANIFAKHIEVILGAMRKPDRFVNPVAQDDWE